MRTGHIVADAHGNVTGGPVGSDILEFLAFQRGDGLLLAAAEAEHTHTALGADEVHGELEGVATTAGEDLVGAIIEDLTGLRPTVLPDDRTDGEGAAAAEVEVSFPVEGHLLGALLSTALKRKSVA